VTRLLAQPEAVEALPPPSIEPSAPNSVLDSQLLIGKPYLATRS